MRFAFSLRENIDEKTSSCKQKNARRPADLRPDAGCHLAEMGNRGIMRKCSAFSNPHRPYDWLGIFGCDSPIRLSGWRVAGWPSPVFPLPSHLWKGRAGRDN